jgi:hypothetical protein
MTSILPVFSFEYGFASPPILASIISTASHPNGRADSLSSPSDFLHLCSHFEVTQLSTQFLVSRSRAFNRQTISASDWGNQPQL